MKLDTSKDGIESVFRKYQSSIVDILHDEGEHGSGAMHKKLASRSVKISRASVTFFLNDLFDAGLATFWEKSGKGGYAKIYKINLTREEFNMKIVEMFCLKLHEAFGFEWLKTVWEER